MRIVDLFSGCGGMSLGFQNAGFKIEAAFDSWKTATNIYKSNFDHPIYTKDLMQDDSVDFIKQFNPQMIIGGPPCQDFSIAGKRNDLGERANLTIRFAEIIKEVQPEWVVMENVYNITRSSVLPKALDIIKKAGYGISYEVLNSSYLNVPQARKRFFLVAHKHSDDGFLNERLKSNHTEHPMTVRDFFGDSLKTQYYYAHPRSYNRRAVFSIDEPSSTIRGVNRPIPSTYKLHPADKCTEISQVRPLTTKERSLIQTFPETFVFEGSKTALEQAIGNAVPIKMAEHVANSIKKYLKE